MIVTLTLNPSVDRTVDVDTLVRGAVVRARDVHVDPGGKGINVSRALAGHDIKTRAVVTTGGAEGRHLVALLQAEGIDIVGVRSTARRAPTSPWSSPTAPPPSSTSPAPSSPRRSCARCSTP
jgi:1-phosphofructokinase